MSLFLYLYVMEYSWDEIVEMFNNGDLDVPKYFNDYQTFFKVLKKRGLMGEIDPKNADGGENWQNEYLLWLYENDRENYYKWIPTLLNDVVFENRKAYLEIHDRGDLAKLFCDGHRYDLSRDTIETILSGDGDAYEPYWDTTQDVYSDVIEELTPENDKRLGEYIVKTLNGQQISADTDELQLISSEQGHPDYVEVNMENVKRIIDDEETMKELLGDQLSDLKSELYSIHSSAYNSAYEESVWAELWSELGTYFEGDGEWISKPHPYKKNTEIQYFKIPIRNFESDVNDYLFNNKGYGNSGTLEYHGGFIEIMKEDRDCLSAQAPDYPDYRKLDKNINEYFKHYI
jgi:hypothetical protein